MIALCALLACGGDDAFSGERVATDISTTKAVADSVSPTVILARSAGAKKELQEQDFADRPHRLVRTACGSCHLPPSPDLLPSALWDTVVLPRMGQFMGHYATPVEREQLLGPAGPERDRLAAANVYPTEPTLTEAEWDAVRAYYLRLAKPTLPATTFAPAAPTSGFRARFPELFLSPPSTTYVGFRGNRLLLGDVNKETVVVLNDRLRPVARLPLGRGLTDATGWTIGSFAVAIGSFSPTERGTGTLHALTAAGPQLIGRGLQRPTSVVAVDPDADGQPELLVTEYGKWTGRLSRWRKAGGGWQASTLTERPGALRVRVDPLATQPTIYVLFGQGREEIVRYVFAAGIWNPEVVQRFPPSYGSSSLWLTDWDDDGHTDLLYTNGDNADYRSPVKPYHGIRLFRGAANGTFTEAFFLPFPGAYAALPGDFDGDGRKDLAAISFFPDFTASEPSGAVVFTQSSPGTFAARPLPAAGAHRYLTLAAGDYDGDGDTDLAAGCLAMEPVPDDGRLAGWVANGLPAVIWENLQR